MQNFKRKFTKKLMPNRIIAITTTYLEYDILNNIVEKIKSPENEIHVFSSYDFPENHPEIIFHHLENEIANSDPKTKNFVLKYFFENNQKGFVHLIEENLVIEKDPKEFIEAIESLMKALKLQSWFQTRCDECNYVLTKYNPRLKIPIDIPEMSEKFSKTIYYTSHSNPLWAIYDYDIANFENVSYDEEFLVPMFYIIDFLARKRNRGEGFMNYYPTIEEENGVFKQSPVKVVPRYNIATQMQKDGMHFQAKNIDHHPNNNPLDVLDFVYKTLKG